MTDFGSKRNGGSSDDDERSSSGPSGYTPFDDLHNGGSGGQGDGMGLASSYAAACYQHDDDNDENDMAQEEEEQQQQQSTTFMLAPPAVPDDEPEGWSDYSDDGGGDDGGGSGEGNEHTTGGDGAFYANMAAFHNGDGEHADEQNTTLAAQGYAPLSAVFGDADADDDNSNTGGGDEGFDFRAIADQALRALDDEYLTTVQQPLKSDPQMTIDEVGSSPAASKVIETTAAAAEDDDDDDDDDDDAAVGQTSNNAPSDNTLRNDDENGQQHLESASRPHDDKLHQSILPTKPITKELPAIDGDAVLRAVTAIKLKSPDLANNLDAGAERRLDAKYRLSLAPTLVPSTHLIIPSAPLAAFRKTTSKAISATANLSRSATIAEGIVRCLPHLLLPTPTSASGTSIREERKTLKIHVIGSDHVECQSHDTVRMAVGPLVRWIGAACSSHVSSVNIELLGPNITVAAERRGVTNLLPTPSTIAAASNTDNSRIGDSGLKSAGARCINALYHDYLKEKDNIPDIAIAFNAGIWGYDEWRPTLAALCDVPSLVPVIITGYTVQEAEDDAEVISEITGASAMAGACFRDANIASSEPNEKSAKGRCLWGAEINPFGSREKRDTASAPNGREYRENGAWQAWLFGCCK